MLVRCAHCENLHLISDRLGWFGARTNIEEILNARGDEVKRMLAEEEQQEGEGLLHIEWDGATHRSNE
mgnify:CR=1 FL=1